MICCYRHPDADALFDCEFCGKPICGDCLRYVEDDEQTIICPDCTSDAILEEAEDTYDIDQIEHANIQKKLAGVGRLRVEQVLNVWFVFLLILMVAASYGMNWYLEKSLPPIQINDQIVQNSGSPVLEFSLLLAAVFAYSEDNRGYFPEKLTQLYPDFINKIQPTVLNTKDSYAFAADAKSGFVLSCTISDRFGLKKLFATREGVINFE